MENNIKKYRKERSMTQDDLAKAAGVTRQTVISLENGRYDASLRLAHRLAVIFETSIEELFVFED